MGVGTVTDFVNDELNLGDATVRMASAAVAVGFDMVTDSVNGDLDVDDTTGAVAVRTVVPVWSVQLTLG